MVLMTKRTPAETSLGYDSKMEKEIKTVGLMIHLYCRGHHGNKDSLCSECTELLDYVKQRLERCPIKEKKPKCFKCSVHCYRPGMRKKIKAVMKYSGPHMLYRHPILSGRHYLAISIGERQGLKEK
jgi:hypothetical protein